MTCAKSLAVAVTSLTVCLACVSCPCPGAGSVRGSIDVDGQTRTYLVHVPAAFDADHKLPLVIALHPFTGTGETMERMTGLSALADREGFLVAYPDGRQRVWNADPAAPSSILGPPADDVAFISALIDRLIGVYDADPDRVYMTGASSGGLMTHRVACELTDKLAAAASVMITLPVGWQDGAQPSGPLPFLMIHGTEDPFFPWLGGTVSEGPFRRSEYQSAEETVRFWVENNDATSPPERTPLPDTDPDDGSTVYRESYAAGPEGAEVAFYGVEGGGHTWPGSAETGLAFLVGRTNRDTRATDVIWGFFKGRVRGDRAQGSESPASATETD